MLSPEYYLQCTDALIALLDEYDRAVVADIARRIVKSGVVTETAELQFRAVQEMGLLYDDIISEISHLTDATNNAVRTIFEDAGVHSIAYDNAIYAAAGLSPIPLRASPAMLQMLTAGAENTLGTLHNLTLTTANTSQTAFINACDLATMQIQSGAFSYTEAISAAVRSIGKAGTYVLYPSGHRDRTDVAVRRAVLTGVGKTCRTICLQNAQDIGCDLMEITAHAGARPSHAQWQGKIVSLSGQKGYLTLADIGYGTGDGFGGWNCRHDWFPFILGISDRNYTDDELRQLENKTVTINGNRVNYYDATQMQRQMERDIRKTKRELAAIDAARNETADPALRAKLDSDFAKKSTKLKTQRENLDEFIQQTGFLPDSFRTQVVGYGRSMSAKSVWAARKSVDNVPRSGIIETRGDSVAELHKLGHLDTQPLEIEFRKLKTDEIIITNERIAHIKERHPEDYALFEKHGKSAVEHPDLIIKDSAHENTVFMVKRLEETNLNVVVKLILENDEKDYKNSVMTFYRIRDKNLEKLKKKNKTIYKKE